MQVVRKLAGGVAIAIAIYLFLQNLVAGTFHPFPLTVFAIGLFLFLDFVHTERVDGVRGSASRASATQIAGYALLAVSVLWAAVTSTQVQDARVVWGGAILIGLIGVGLLIAHHSMGYRRALRDRRSEQDAQD